MNIKNLLKAALSVGLFVILSPFILVIAFATSLIWVPFVLLFSTPLAVTYLVLQKTPLGSQVKAFYAKDIRERIEASGGLQYFIVENLNIILCLVFPKLQRKTTNYGYAVLNQDGKLISDIKVEFEDERFPLQLYHYLATSFERYRNLGKWNVLELECEMGGGLEYISKNLKARRAVGITSNDRKAKYCQQTHPDKCKIEFYETGMDQLLQFDPLKGQKFDLIINVEGKSRFGTEKFKEIAKAAEGLLRPGGIFICSDYGTKAEMTEMENELTNSNLKMVKKEDLTVNILHGFKLDKRRKQSLRNLTVYDCVRAAFLKLHSKERMKLEVAFREEESAYYAYLLKKD